MRSGVVLAAAAVLTFTPLTAAEAEINLADHRELREDSAYQQYVEGLGRGIFWAVAHSVRTLGIAAICIPSDAALAEGQPMALLEQEIESGAYGDDSLVEAVMMQAFHSAFACPRVAAPEDSGNPFGEPEE